MSGRDYKSKTPPVGKSRPGGSLLIGIFIGLLLGLGIAVGVAWYINRTPVPFVNKNKPSDKSATPAAPEVTTPTPPAAAGSAPAGGLPPPVGQTPPDKQRFTFYKLLPGTEEPVSEQQIKQAEKSSGSLDNGKVTYFLQAGSFQDTAQAENLKARLALIGVEAAVQQVDVGDKGIWYRVRVGPYAKIEDTTKLREMLAQNGIDAKVMKIKDVPGH
jgi:cell division protein FtsN